MIGIRSTAFILLLLSVKMTAHSQVEINGAGRMLGSTIADRINPRNRDRDRWPAPQPGFTGGVQIIPGSGYYGCGQPVIIVNGTPCYAPGYYSGNVGYGGYGSSYGYTNSGLNVGFQAGGVSLGYRQNSGSFHSNAYATGRQVQAREVIRKQVPTDRANSGYRPVEGDLLIGNRTSSHRDGEQSSVPSQNDYYLQRSTLQGARNSSLGTAIKDIETAFRTGNIASLEPHLESRGALAIQVKGTARRNISTNDYLMMTADALKVMQTVKYELTKVVPASNGAVAVTGSHTLRSESGEGKTFLVGFTLKQRGDCWLITEVSAEPVK